MIPEAGHDGRSRQVRRAEQRQDEKNPLKKDFRKFLFVVWKHLGLPSPTPVQYNIAQFMQHGPRRKMIQAFRGVGKTWVYAAFVCWRLYCNPNWKIMVVSATKPFADDFSKFVKRVADFGVGFAGLEPVFDFRSSGLNNGSGLLGTLLSNPTGDLLQGLERGVKGVASAAVNPDYDFSQQDWRALSKVLLFQNAFGIRNILASLGGELPKFSQ